MKIFKISFSNILAFFISLHVILQALEEVKETTRWFKSILSESSEYALISSHSVYNYRLLIKYRYFQGYLLNVAKGRNR